MFVKQVAMVSLLCGVLSAFAVSAHADNINLSGAVCGNFNAGEAQHVDRLGVGVRNLNTLPLAVICAFARSPAGPGADLPFIVDGNNDNGTATLCTVTAYTQNGVIQSDGITCSKSFTGSGANWRHTVTFDAGCMGPGGQATLLCTLPANGNGQIYGLISVQ